MKKIYLTGAYTTTNYGTHMLTSNFLNYFPKYYEERCKYAVAMINEEEQFEALKKTIPEDISLRRYNYCGVRVGANSLVRYAEGLCTFLQDGLNPIRFRSDVTVVLGGDCISEVYATINGIFWLGLLSIMTRCTKVFLLAQTIGPFHGWRKAWASRVLNKCHIYSRDQWTVDYLNNELGVTSVQPSCDLAFLDLPGQPPTDEVMRKYSLSPNEYFSVIVSPIHRHFVKDYETYLALWEKMLDSLFSMDALQGKRLVFLAHTHRAHLRNEREPDEKHMINAVYERVKDKYGDRITRITDLILPSEARVVLGNGLFTITGRMHASISTYQMGVPAIALTYSPKFKGVIGDELSRNDLIIDNPNKETWNSGRIVQVLADKVAYVLDNREKLCSEIREVMPKVQKKALFQIEDMARILKGE